MFQLRLQSIYTSMPFQVATAITVALNFFVTVSAGDAIGAGGDTRTRLGLTALPVLRCR